MLRKLVSGTVALVLVFAVAGVASAQDKAKGKGKKGTKATVVTITKVEGDKITGTVKVKKGETETKTFTLTNDTKYLDGKKQITDVAQISEFKKNLKEGTKVQIKADADSNVTSIAKVVAKPKKNK
jgi:hypothetical protein